MTQNEEIEMGIRLSLQDDGRSVEEYVSSKGLRGTYGGTYLDHVRGGLLTVGFTSNVDGHRAELMDLVANPQRLEVRQVDYSEDELIARMAEIDSERETLIDLGFDLWELAIDIEANRVTLKGAEVASGGCSAATSRYPDEIVLCGENENEVFLEQLVNNGSSRANDNPPWVPGIPILVSGGTCTLGFSLWLNGGGEYLSTAGHCSDPADVELADVQHNTKIVGRISARQSNPSNGSDMTAIRVTNSRSTNGIVYKEYPDVGLVNRNRSREAQQGWTVCMSGGKSFHHCGVVTNTNTTATFITPTGETQSWSGLVAVRGDVDQNPAVDGDSGAPVWIPSGDDPAEANGAGLLFGGGAHIFAGLRIEGWLFSHLTYSSGAFVLEGYSLRLCSC